MKLKELSHIFPVPDRFAGLDFTGLGIDSREIKPGELFIAIPGYKTDGRLFLKEAFERGAVAALVETGSNIPENLAVITVQDIRRVQGLIAACFYGYPGEQLRIIGVTGTNGKTTVTHLTEHLLRAAGIVSGLVGTVWVNDGKEKKKAERTTPDAIELQKSFASMVRNGVSTVVMEVSSHALSLERVAGTNFDVAVLTNITHDHFDFHYSYRNYLQTKAQLFQGLIPEQGQLRYAVINADDPGATEIALHCRVPVYFYSKSGLAETKLIKKERVGQDTFLTVDLLGEECRILAPLPGEFNIYNILAAITIARLEGLPLDAIETGIRQFPGVPGRYQELKIGQPFRVMIDFAHNPAALESILKMARDKTRRRIILVFGCEGEKDRLKRPKMGKIAAEYADVSILTSDNNYNEDPEQIFSDVLKGVSPNLLSKFIVEPDRREAIKIGIKMANPGDFLIIAGKGHEQYLINGTSRIPFEDEEVVREELVKLDNLGLQTIE